MDKKNRNILIVLFVGVLMGALDISIVGPAIPSIDEVLNITEKEKSWIFSIYIMFNLIGISLLARLSDLFGRRLIYVISVGVFGIIGNITGNPFLNNIIFSSLLFLKN